MSFFTRANPYPKGNLSTTLDFLEELITIVAKEKGSTPIAEDQGGYQDINLTGEGQLISLTVPDHAVSAILAIEGNRDGLLVRYKQNGASPSAISGFGLRNDDFLEVAGKENLARFVLYSLAPVSIRVQYEQTSQVSV